MLPIYKKAKRIIKNTNNIYIPPSETIKDLRINVSP